MVINEVEFFFICFVIPHCTFIENKTQPSHAQLIDTSWPITRITVYKIFAITINIEFLLGVKFQHKIVDLIDFVFDFPLIDVWCALMEKKIS